MSVNYDSMTITMVGKASELEQVISVLRNAILSTQFTPEVVTRIRDARIKSLRDATVSPAMAQIARSRRGCSAIFPTAGVRRHA